MWDGLVDWQNRAGFRYLSSPGRRNDSATHHDEPALPWPLLCNTQQCITPSCCQPRSAIQKRAPELNMCATVP